MRTVSLTVAGLPTDATVHEPAPERDRHTAVVYLHGGGLLYGQRDDLPRPYLDLILERGYTLYCLDYPLAPEAPLPRIVEGVEDGWRWLVDEEFPQASITKYALFGRSAGAYLALLLAARIRRQPAAPQPMAVISLYGYDRLTERLLNAPAAAYRALPPVGDACVAALAGREPVTSGPLATRYALYVHARQTGSWGRLLGVEDEAARAAFSLDDEDEAALPPLFIAASADDEDVPYSESKALFRRCPQARMRTVYGLPHDFDRDTANPAGRQVYKEFLDILDDTGVY